MKHAIGDLFEFEAGDAVDITFELDGKIRRMSTKKLNKAYSDQLVGIYLGQVANLTSDIVIHKIFYDCIMYVCE